MSFIPSLVRRPAVPVLLCALAVVGCDGASGGPGEDAARTVPYSTHDAVDVPVFPGAEGFGTRTPAGRGGRVCKVTNLQDRGEGSFRACAERGGPRIVVFETGGTIVLDEEIRISDPFISIYGQTAPGDGILLRSHEGTTDSVLR